MRTILATLGIIAITPMIQSEVIPVRVLEGGTVFAPWGNDRMDLYKLLPVWHIFRRTILRPHVEAGPGFFKSDPVEYSPNRLAQEYKKLFALKKRMEERDKPLSP
ncbi:uncharacterized protein LOC119840087 [Zerene cesonia]|uniref:uncharacterized protein LOC119840087 n=1 Tax=Zerene cesonia TaxID=33412 RepID=UPI0018E55494|nr:uncharacterized protein LOC119840087 [Zerene cesonia]